jgi:hypothetical protein
MVAAPIPAISLNAGAGMVDECAGALSIPFQASAYE